MNPNTLKRLAALERIRKTVSPCRGRSPEEVAHLLCDYDHLWNDGAVIQSRSERYLHNLELIDAWSHTSLQEKLQKYSGLFNEV